MLGRVRVRTLVVTRWFAIGGQVITLLVVSEGLGAALPMGWAMAAVGCSAVLNLWLGLRRGLAGWHGEREAAGYLAYDILQLAVLLYLTGGLQNPFSLLLLVPVTVSATILSLASTIFLTGLALVCITILVVLHTALPWPAPGLALPPVYTLGTWTALALGMAFLTFYAWRVAEEARRRADALAETQLSLAREQTLSSVGALAAAAAHELGTPLGTIALVAKELARELPPDSDHGEDVQLLNSQVARCREILARLTRDPGGGGDRAFAEMPMRSMVMAAAEPLGRDGVTLAVEAEETQSDGSTEPVVRRSAELQQGLVNLIENAFEFARSQVRVQVGWDGEEVRVAISDDGPGFPAGIMELLGEPYVGTRRERGRMGLGVFISKTLLERTGADIRFANRHRGGGAEVGITWPRGAIESSRPEAEYEGSQA
jgi:two-component system sensor histidine kinase RegB